MKNKICILSIDGGGLRGLIPTLILKYMQKHSKKHMYQHFNLLAGTSTGGLLVCAMTYSKDNLQAFYNLNDIENIYRKYGPYIFPRPKTKAGRAVDWLQSWWGPEYNNKNLEQVLQKHFAKDRISSLLRPVLVPAYDLRTSQPLYFKSRYVNRGSAGYSIHRNSMLTDVCMATAAGPTYFASHRFMYSNESGENAQIVNCIDGGIYMNNPSMAALVELWKYYNDPIYARGNFNEMPAVHLLSIGTGNYQPGFNTTQSLHWGKLQWVSPLIELMLLSANQTVVNQVHEALKVSSAEPWQEGHNSLLRLNVHLPKPLQMSDSSDDAMNCMEEALEQDVFRNSMITEQILQFMERAFES